MEQPDEGGATWFRSDGTPYEGDVNLDAKGKPFGDGEAACGRCGGSGRWSRNRRLSCVGCAGEGTKFEQFKVYDATALAKLEKGRESRAGNRTREVTRRQEALERRYADYREAHSEVFDKAEAIGNSFVKTLLAKAREWGGLTEGQREKLYEIVGEIEAARALHARSAFVGVVGVRFKVEVRCVDHGSFTRKPFKPPRVKVNGRWRRDREAVETVHATSMVDVDGNVLFAMTPTFELAIGDQALVSATVKKHDDGKGYPVTVVNRVVVHERVAAPPLPWPAPPRESRSPATAPVPVTRVDDGYDPDFEEYVAQDFEDEPSGPRM